MNKLLKLIAITTIFMLNSNISATTYIMKILEKNSDFQITCDEGKHLVNATCFILINKIDKCPDGYENYNSTKCKSLTPINKSRLCPSGYSYSSGSQSCKQSVTVGWADGSCGGGHSGCRATVSPSDCYWTCSDGTENQGWYYERCSTGYGGGDGRCYSDNYTSYTLSSCTSGFVSVGTTCARLIDKILNVCPEGLTDYNETQCY
jgi:hypothetical protein